MGRWQFVWLPTLLQAAFAALLCFVPLFDLLGYEFSFAIGLLSVVTGMTLGLGVGRRVSNSWRALVLALALAVLHLLPALLLITLNALRVRNCDYTEGLAFFTLLPMATSLYAAALGLLIGRLLVDVGRHWRVLAAVLTAGTPLVACFVSLYFDPAIFAYDHLWGYFAGSLYDEAMSIDRPLLWLRVGTLLRISAVAGLVVAWDHRRRLTPARLAGAFLAVSSALVVFELTVGPATGFRSSRAEIEAALPIIETRPGLVIHLPKSTSRKDREALANEHAFALSRLESRLGMTPMAPIHSYVYANANDKARLMGGRSTMISKPWLHEIHIHDAVVPHPVLAHELVHALAAELAEGPLYVSAEYGILVNMGLVEGLAEALSLGRGGELDLDAYARAMRDLRILPDVRAIVGPTGFWTEAGPRAYAAAGSFVRFLLDTYGAEALKRAYAHADFEAAYHQSLDALVAAWQAHLDTIRLTPREMRIAEDQLRERSMFARTCAREIAQLKDRAAHAEPAAAVALYRQVAEHLSRAPAAELDVATALERADDDDGFLTLADELAEARGLTSAQRATLLEKRGDLFWRKGDLSGARESFEAVLALTGSFDTERLHWVKLWALRQTPELRDTLRDFLNGKLQPLAAVLALELAPITTDEDRTLPYLVARQLARVEAYESAIAHLERAAPHPFAPIEAERRRLLGECLWHLGRFDAAARAYESYADVAMVSGERARAWEWVARLEHLATLPQTAP